MIAKTLTVGAVVLAAGALTVAPAFAVAGGQPVTDPTTAPWMATIAFKGSQPLVQREMCGGVLIAPDRVATAGHCLDHTDPTTLELHLGGGTLSTDPGRILGIKGFTMNPGYRLVPSPLDPGSFEMSAVADDVAIIELSRPVTAVRPLPVAENSPQPGTAVSVFGHGLTGIDQKDPASQLGDALSRGELRVIDDKNCNTQLDGVVDAGSVVCGQSSGSTTCSGDSGGPLVQYARRGPELVGLTSFGGEVVNKECVPGEPGGFADAAALRSFLTQTHPVSAPMPAGEPTITGSKTAGDTVTCQQPTWLGSAPDSVQYVWDYDDVAPDGFDMYVPIKDVPQQQNLAVTKELAGEKLMCVLTAKTTGGVVELFTNPK